MSKTARSVAQSAALWAVRAAGTARLRLASLPPLWAEEYEVAEPNGLFSRRRVRELRGHSQRIAHADPYLRSRLADRRIGGVRDWEYGTLLGFLRRYPDRASWRALDVGSGNSTFPRYLARTGNVGGITTLDLPDAHEPATAANIGAARRDGVERVHGSMLELPFPDRTFDLVTCISAVEHLEGDRFHDPKPPHSRFADDTRRALREMVRVLTPGGLLFVTSEAFMPERQSTDAWSSPDGSTPIWNAYPFEDINDLFLSTVLEAGATLVGEASFDPARLTGDADHSNFRGRYFTTFCVAAQRDA